jgi:hypothetical protein
MVVNDDIPVIKNEFDFLQERIITHSMTMRNTIRESLRSRDDTHKEDERVSTARRLRRIKRRLFLEHADNAEVAVTMGTKPNQIETCAIRKEERLPISLLGLFLSVADTDHILP